MSVSLLLRTHGIDFIFKKMLKNNKEMAREDMSLNLNR